jgi:predicted TIM-barrel fold metal-dependent hydrolase
MGIKMKKIDIHCHTTLQPLHDCAEPDASVWTLAGRMEAHDISEAFLYATYFPHRGTGISNYRLAQWLGRVGYAQRQDVDSLLPEARLSMFGSLDMEHYFLQGMSELEELREHPVQAVCMQGIKMYTCYQDIDLSGERMHAVMDFARKEVIPVAFHCGYSYMSIRKGGGPSVARMVRASDLSSLAKEYGDVPIMVAHMSKPYLDDLIATILAHPNMVTDMSGLIDSKHDRQLIPQCIDDIRRFLYECGPTRLLFGTDFPVQTHADSVYFIEEAMKGFSEEDKRSVYHDNARKILRIGGGSDGIAFR